MTTANADQGPGRAPALCCVSLQVRGCTPRRQASASSPPSCGRPHHPGRQTHLPAPGTVQGPSVPVSSPWGDVGTRLEERQAGTVSLQLWLASPGKGKAWVETLRSQPILPDLLSRPPGPVFASVKQTEQHPPPSRWARGRTPGTSQPHAPRLSKPELGRWPRAR